MGSKSEATLVVDILNKQPARSTCARIRKTSASRRAMKASHQMCSHLRMRVTPGRTVHGPVCAIVQLRPVSAPVGEMANVGRVAHVSVMLALATSCVLGSSPCDDPAVANLPFCNPGLDLVDRVKDLVSRMSVADMISQLGNTAPAIEHLNIPAYQWWSEALHGVASSPGVSFGGKVPNATSFPQVIGVAATFNSTLFYEMGQAISTEARAMNNAGHAGLTYFTPNINIYRDPRWGRGQETPGEDPYLTSTYAVQYVTGLQYGPDQRYLKTVACCKHFAAYDLENWNGTDRYHFNAIVSDQDLAETYFPAFESCVRVAKVASIMCSYNAVNGVPSCANDVIQNQIVRNEWDFAGFIVSDCGAINTILADHHYTNTTEETVQVALRAGTNLNCGGFYQKYAQDAYDKQYITEEDLANAVGPLFGQRMALGMFDPTDLQPYLNISTDQIDSPAHQALALDAARESIVLLQNDGSLPLSAEPSLKVAVIGPNSNATKTMQGNYHGVAPYLISPLMGIQAAGVTAEWAFGCDVACSDTAGFTAAVQTASAADVVVMVMGLDQGQEREGHDRNVLSLPGQQLQLLQQVRAATASRPLVLVLMSGGPVDISWAKSNANAILWTGYPGQSGGEAIADVLFGKFNPSGRLPVTFYPADYVNQLSFFNMSMRDPPGRTYKFYTGTPVFEFGHGLSYTTFSFVWSELPEGSSDEGLTLSCSELIERGQVDYRVKVTNTGKTGGGVSALAFVSSEVKGAPLKELFGFQKVFLEPGESVELIFAALSEVFALVDQQGKRTLTPGRYWVAVEDQRHLLTLV